LKEMELTKQKNTPTKALSGGEKARTTIARAYVHNPLVLFADEPTGNLDPGQSSEVLDLLKHIHKKGTTIVLATHEVDIVDALQTRVIRLKGGNVIRDSVGGYETETRKKVKAPRKGMHDIFEHDEEDDKKSGRKVKITSIG
ncbi:MAG: ATP-binding cassette domain-containing protein, partial [Candidatus Peribacteraceae bacterium]|nr:ATP-binding cassette domain-containing protein [Candidatus Peribacteraceae bacterium]